MTTDPEEVEPALAAGAVEVLGLLPYSSNYTFLVRVGASGNGILAVYKPSAGERPLWDFPHGTLAAREVAAYAVSEAAGWHLVPHTVMREDAPLGPGSLQAFVEHDPDRHYLVLRDERLQDLEVFAAFDVVVNNADRKSGHVLEDPDGRLWAVDHGLTFHTEPKLRTVIWDFAAEPVAAPIKVGLGRLRAGLADGDLGALLEGILDEPARAAALERVETLLASGRYPEPSSDRPYPWPLV